MKRQRRASTVPAKRQRQCELPSVLEALLSEMRGEIWAHLSLPGLASVAQSCKTLYADVQLRRILALPPAWRKALDDVRRIPNRDDVKKIHRAVQELVQFGVIDWPGVNHHGSVSLEPGHLAHMGWDWYSDDGTPRPRFVRLCHIYECWQLTNNLWGVIGMDPTVESLNRVSAAALAAWKDFVARRDRRYNPKHEYGRGYERSICYHFYENGSLVPSTL